MEVRILTSLRDDFGWLVVALFNTTVVVVRNDRFFILLLVFIMADLYYDRHHFKSSSKNYRFSFGADMCKPMISDI